MKNENQSGHTPKLTQTATGYAISDGQSTGAAPTISGAHAAYKAAKAETGASEHTGHTPGPRFADTDPVFGNMFVRQDPNNWDGMGYQYICGTPSGTKGGSRDMFKANAHLIAAAPDLLAALESVKAEYESHLAPDELNFKEYKMVCAAISKAKGQSCPA